MGVAGGVPETGNGRAEPWEARVGDGSGAEDRGGGASGDVSSMRRLFGEAVVELSFRTSLSGEALTPNNSGE